MPNQTRSQLSHFCKQNRIAIYNTHTHGMVTEITICTGHCDTVKDSSTYFDLAP